MNDSARAGLEQLGARGEVRGADAVLGAARVTVRRRRDRSRAVLALGVIVVLGVAAVLVSTRDRGEDGREIVTQPGTEDGAPPADAGPVSLYLSDTVLPPSGGEVIAIVRNASSVDEVFGAVSFLDRWDGVAWQKVQRFPDEQYAVPDVGLPAPASGSGLPERLPIGPLEPGWYRLRKEAVSSGTAATGTFEVVAGDVHMIDLPMGQHGLLIDSPLLERVDGVLANSHLSLTFVLHFPSEPGTHEDVVSRLSTDARLDRWDGTAWVDVSSLDLANDPSTPSLAATDVPTDLVAGAYRVTRTIGSGPDAHGYFFVVDALVGDARPPVTTTIGVSDPDAPPADEGPVTLFLSDRVLPATGADVIVIVRNRGTEPVSFGVEAEIERWDGAAWTSVKPVLADGTYTPAYGAWAGSVGPSQRLHIAGLDPGWYRLRKDLVGGGSATATFEVAGAETPTIHLGSTRMDGLRVFPGLVRQPCPQCGVRLGMALGTDGVPGRDLDALEAALDPVARVERWDGNRWEPVGELDFSIEAVANWDRQPGERMARLPAELTPGAHRVIRTAPDGTELTGVFFVE